MSEIKLQISYLGNMPTLEQIESMISVQVTEYDSANSVWRLPDGAVLETTNDGRYYDVTTKQEYRCIMAYEYDNNEPIEGIPLGFLKK